MRYRVLKTLPAVAGLLAILGGCNEPEDPSITVIHPNGDGCWVVGANETVIWATEGSVGNVAIELSVNGGGDWSTLVPNTPNDGSEAILVPDSTSTLCLIRVSEADGSPSDMSDATFAIDVTAPLPRVWYVDSDAVASGGGTSWADAFKTVQEGIAAASAGDEVWVAEGIYKPTAGLGRYVSFVLAEGVSFYGGFAGTEQNRNERDWTTHIAVLSGDIGTVGVPWDNSYRVIIGASNARLDGFTIEEGTNDSRSFYGGGIYNACVTNLTVANCTFAGNSAEYGGGIYNWGSSLAVIDCAFLDNSAGAAGGGLHSEGSSVEITNSVLVGNAAGDGGALYARESSVMVESCVFVGNVASANGGAVCNSLCAPTITNCLFVMNSADVGGGIDNYNCDGTIMNCTFYGNTATTGGGGIVHSWIAEGSDQYVMIVKNCILWGDSAPAYEELWGDPEVSYSCVEGGYSGVGNIGEDVVNHDPLFIDPDGLDDTLGTSDDDLRLSASSPCIDAGTAMGAPDHDLDGSSRPLGSGYDMGAYEQ